MNAAQRDLGSDREAILALEAAYAPRWDANDGVGWSNLFTVDGVFAAARPDGSVEVRARGREELKGRCDLFNSTMRGIHSITRPDLNIDGDRARAMIPFTFTGVGTVAGRRLEVAGMYKVEYAHGAEGWKIHYRFEVQFSRLTQEMWPRDVDDLPWLSEALG